MEMDEAISYQYFPSSLLLGEAYPEEKKARGRLSRAACDAPRLNVALARLVDLKARAAGGGARARP